MLSRLYQLSLACFSLNLHVSLQAWMNKPGGTGSCCPDVGHDTPSSPQGQLVTQPPHPLVCLKQPSLGTSKAVLEAQGWKERRGKKAGGVLMESVVISRPLINPLWEKQHLLKKSLNVFMALLSVERPTEAHLLQ